MQIKSPKDYGFFPQHIAMDGSGWKDLTETLPFSLEADDFINFASLDMKGKANKDLVNALGNIKRAIENRMDGVLFAFKYQESARDWSFPDKVRKLNKLGIISPRILKKINRVRNLLEHQYRIPRKQEVEDAYDVAILFLAYTRNFLKRFVTDYQGFSEKKMGEIIPRIDFEFEEKGLRADVNGTEYYVEPLDPRYDEWIKFIIEACY